MWGYRWPRLNYAIIEKLKICPSLNEYCQFLRYKLNSCAFCVRSLCQRERKSGGVYSKDYHSYLMIDRLLHFLIEIIGSSTEK